MKKILLAMMALSPFFSSAANFVMDARTQAIAGAGTASASFLSAGFYNPALAALYDGRKSYGALFPALGIRFRDPDEIIDGLEDFSGVYNSFQNQATNASIQASTLQALNQVKNKTAVVAGGIAASAGIATPNISGVFFISSFTEGIAISEITQSDLNNISQGILSTPTSKARVVGAGIIDMGLALATKLDIKGFPIAVGVTPKIQKIYTYHQEVSITSFDISDWTDLTNRTDDSTYNLDFGIAWQKGALRIGAAGKNIFSREVVTARRTRSFTYKLNPLFTLGAAWQTQKYNLSVDLDLNKQERLLADPYLVDDDTQFIRIGGEYDLTNPVKLRAGFIHDLQNNVDATLTLGLGIAIDDLAKIDVALELADKNSYGGMVQLSFGL